MDKFTRKLLKLLAGYSIFIAAFIFIFKTILMISFIPTGSMEGTIMAGDTVLATRCGIGEGEIKRYDILIFIPADDTDVTYIKRVIGLPGETIEVKNGKVYANGIELDDSFLQNPMNRKGDGIYKVPEDCYFFLGDNRNRSNDSRFWDKKYVPGSNIVAKAVCVMLPFHDIRYKESY